MAQSDIEIWVIDSLAGRRSLVTSELSALGYPALPLDPTDRFPDAYGRAVIAMVNDNDGGAVDRVLDWRSQRPISCVVYSDSLKAKRAAEWLNDGHRVKVDLFLWGRYKYMEFEFLKERLERFLANGLGLYHRRDEPGIESTTDFTEMVIGLDEGCLENVFGYVGTSRHTQSMPIQRIAVSTDQHREGIAFPRQNAGDDVLVRIDVCGSGFFFRHGHGARITPH